jgi:uncharacterized protein with HEPN domain
VKRETRDYFLDIIQSIADVADFTSGMDFESFSRDRKTVNAVIRSLEILGEAAKNIPQEFKEKYPAMPWKRMAGMRDKLIHEYHGVDLEIVWQVIKSELPPLAEKLNAIFNKLK